MKYTKGNWIKRPSTDDKYIIEAKEPWSWDTDGKGYTTRICEASIWDANLIASAPEMLKALKAMTKLFEERVPYPNNTQRYKQAINVITKVEGKIE